MRAFDRDLIRGGHYGQRSCEPHLKAEHTAATTNPGDVKKALANSEPSTHGAKRTWAGRQSPLTRSKMTRNGPRLNISYRWCRARHAGLIGISIRFGTPDAMAASRAGAMSAARSILWAGTPIDPASAIKSTAGSMMSMAMKRLLRADA
jgi:hypothetical protein